jgi:hypothetical protein
MSKVYKPKNWGELLEMLFVDSWNEQIARYRSPYAFRGMHEDFERVESSLMRLRGDYDKMEKHLLRNFRKYAHKNIVESDTVWNWISLAKHYNLPTRLLDFTYSPFIALHFATEKLKWMERDGVVWCVNYKKVHNYLPDKFKKKLSEEGSDVFTVEMLAESVGSLNEFDELQEKVLLFFEPPSVDERITAQYALFSVISDAKIDISSWLREHEECYFKIIIPASMKWEIRDKLDQININERLLFPGLDGLSRWLRRMYSYKGDDR